MNISNRLKELRLCSGLTQKRLASTLGLSVTCYAGYEQGYREPDLYMLIKIANYYSVSTDYLLGREDEMGQIIVAPDLSDTENTLLQQFRSLPEARKRTLLDMIADMYNANKMSSIQNKSIS